MFTRETRWAGKSRESDITLCCDYSKVIFLNAGYCDIIHFLLTKIVSQDKSI